MKLSRKDPLREKHSFVFFLMRKKPLQTLAGSVRVCYHLCWWLGTGSQGTRKYRSFQFARAALTLHSTAWLQHQQPEMPSEFWWKSFWESGQRIVSLHSRLCSEEGESCGLVGALVVCGRHFGRRMEGDELRAPQLWRWRSSCPCFLGLPIMRWVIICTTINNQEWKRDTPC